MLLFEDMIWKLHISLLFSLLWSEFIHVTIPTWTESGQCSFWLSRKEWIMRTITSSKAEDNVVNPEKSTSLNFCSQCLSVDRSSYFMDHSEETDGPTSSKPQCFPQTPAILDCILKPYLSPISHAKLYHSPFILELHSPFLTSSAVLRASCRFSRLIHQLVC